jgi:hypothetical protein
MTDEVRDRITQTLAENPDTKLVADGSFGMYSDNGLSSYNPPEGFAESFGIRVADYSNIDEYDIAEGRNIVETQYGSLTIETPTGYAVLEPRGKTDVIASIDGQTVAVRTADGRFTWYGLSFSAGFGDVDSTDIVLGILRDAGIRAPLAMDGDRVIPVVRESAQGGRLVFLFNIERRDSTVFFSPRWEVGTARDLLAGTELSKDGEFFQTAVPQWSVGVVHCA